MTTYITIYVIGAIATVLLGVWALATKNQSLTERNHVELLIFGLIWPLFWVYILAVVAMNALYYTFRR